MAGDKREGGRNQKRREWDPGEKGVGCRRGGVGTCRIEWTGTKREGVGTRRKGVGTRGEGTWDPG